MLVEAKLEQKETIHLSAKDIEAWAHFSGDWNPIHFDADAAMALGVDAPFAHGMLALLPVKQLAHNMLSDTSTEWLTIDSRLRLPVFLNEDLYLSGEIDTRGVEIGLRNSSGKLLLSCGARAAQHPRSELQETMSRTPVTPSDISAFDQINASALTDGPFAAWITLEAIAFRNFLKTVDGVKLGQSIAVAAGIEPPQNTASPLVMQTRNTVSVDVSASLELGSDDKLWTDVSIESKDLGKGAHFVQVTVTAGRGDRLILSSVESMTLKYTDLGAHHD
ncbi:MAG: MaoC family dehydratase [Sulfitobacter sp.]